MIIKKVSLLSCIVAVLFAQVLWSEPQKWKYIGPDSGSLPDVFDSTPLVADRRHPSVFYAMVGGGLYGTTNQGARWKLCPLQNVLQIAVHPITSELFATTADQAIVLWKSSDFGRTFTWISEAPLYRFFLDPYDPSILFGFDVIHSALLKSTDGGRNWESIAFHPYDFRDLVFSPFDSQTLYLSAVAIKEYADIPHLLASYDLGKSWTILEKTGYSFHFDPLYPKRVFAFNNNELKVLHKTRGWVHKADLNTEFISFIAFPDHPKRLLGLSKDNVWPQLNVFESVNGGQTWSPLDINLNGHLTAIVSVDDAYGTLLAGTEGGGIYRRDDSQDWKRSSKGLHEAYVNSITAAENALYVLFYRSYFASMLNSKHWLIQSFSNIASWEVEVNPQDPNIVYMVYYDGDDDDYFTGVSYDAGKNWNRIGQYTGITIDPVHPNILYLNQWGDLYKSFDGGKTAQVLPIHPNSYQLLIDEYNDQILYMVGYKGLYKSSDGGQSMESIDPVNGNEHAVSIAFLTRPNSLLAYTSRGSIYRSHDAGRSWHKLATVECNPPRDCYGQISAADENHYFLITKAKLFESLDAGKRWSDNTQAVGKDIQILEMTDPRRFPFYLGTSRGVFKSQ